MTSHTDVLSRIRSAHTAALVGKRKWKDRLASRIVASGLLAVALVAGSAPVLAHDPSEETSIYEEFNSVSPEEAAIRAPFVELGALDSHVGEDKEVFMLRVARVLDAFTVRTGHEACGAVMETQSKDAWRVRLITNRSQIACVRVIFEEDGFGPTEETIHSHPLGSKHNGGRLVHVNAVDSKLIGFTCGRRLSIFDQDFSAHDVKNGSGYLVARGRLLHLKEGDANSRLVGAIDRDAPLDQLHISMPQQIAGSEKIFSVDSPTPRPLSVQVWNRHATGEGLPSLSCKRPK